MKTILMEITRLLGDSARSLNKKLAEEQERAGQLAVNRIERVTAMTLRRLTHS